MTATLTATTTSLPIRSVNDAGAKRTLVLAMTAALTAKTTSLPVYDEGAKRVQAVQADVHQYARHTAGGMHD